MSYAVQGALLSVPAIGFASLAFDLSWIASVGDELQNAADSAALAGVAHLTEPRDAVIVAQRFASMHTVGMEPVTLEASDVEIGTWAEGRFSADPDGDHLRVTGRATRPLWLADMLGISSFDATRESVATIRNEVLCGLISLSNVELNGSSQLSSYDSTDATAPTNEAGVCSNLTSVAVQNGTSVDGSVLAGPGGSVTVAATAKVTGRTGAMSQAITPPQVVKPGTYAALPESITVPTQLPPGNYYRKGSFSISRNGALYLSGETHLYIDGDIKITSGGLVNTTGDPKLFSVEVIGKHSVYVGTTSKFHGSLIAPECEMELNNGAAMYGFFVGNYIHVNGRTAVFLDRALAEDYPAGGTAALVQ
ncbi:MAG: Tad domain-containing protein [Myxococcota bacterium]